MPALFLDTGVLLGAVLPRDPHHEASLSILDRISSGAWSEVYTSDHVLVEAVNYITRKRPHRDALDAALRLVFGAPEAPAVVTDVLHVHSGRLAAGLDLLKQQFERGLSLTDCTTVVLMRELGIRDLATFDSGFGGLVETVDGARRER